MPKRKSCSASKKPISNRRNGMELNVLEYRIMNGGTNSESAWRNRAKVEFTDLLLQPARRRRGGRAGGGAASADESSRGSNGGHIDDCNYWIRKSRGRHQRSKSLPASLSLSSHYYFVLQFSRSCFSLRGGSSSRAGVGSAAAPQPLSLKRSFPL